jgi:hypothetical protein
MEVQLPIPAEHISEIIEFYVNKQKDLKFRSLEIDMEIKEIGNLLARLRDAESNALNIQDHYHTFSMISDLVSEDERGKYSPEWPWFRKIRFALLSMKKPATTREIIDFLSLHEADIINDRKKAVSNISSILSSRSGTYYDKRDFIKGERPSGENDYRVWQELTEQERFILETSSKHTRPVNKLNYDLPF